MKYTAKKQNELKRNYLHRNVFIGDKFNRLVIIADAGVKNTGKNNAQFVDCLCDCGKKITCRFVDVVRGHTLSCGCANKKYIYNINVFLDEDDISYYLLGVFCSDGNISKSKDDKNYVARIMVKDKEWIESLAMLICPDKPINVRNGKYYGVSIHDQDIVNWLMKKGCVPNKSLVLECSDIPEKHLLDFMRGFIDGDGHINCYRMKKNRINKSADPLVYIIGGSEKMIDSICLFYDKYDINYNKKIVYKKDKNPKHNDLYAVKVYGKNAYKLVKILYENNNIDKISLQRKLNTAKEIINYYDNNLNDMTGENNGQFKKSIKHIVLILKEWRTNNYKSKVNLYNYLEDKVPIKYSGMLYILKKYKNLDIDKFDK